MYSCIYYSVCYIYIIVNSYLFKMSNKCQISSYVVYIVQLLVYNNNVPHWCDLSKTILCLHIKIIHARLTSHTMSHVIFNFDMILLCDDRFVIWVNLVTYTLKLNSDWRGYVYNVFFIFKLIFTILSNTKNIYD